MLPVTATPAELKLATLLLFIATLTVLLEELTVTLLDPCAIWFMPPVVPELNGTPLAQL